MAADANTKLVATAFARIEEHLEAMREWCDDDEVDELESKVHDLVRDVACVVGVSGSDAVAALRKVAPLKIDDKKLRARITDELGAFAADQDADFRDAGEHFTVAASAPDAVKRFGKLLRRFAELDPEQPEVHRLLELVS
jgi:hypothetical protein